MAETNEQVDAVLREDGKLIAHRRESYGDPAEFFQAVAKRWTLTLGIPVTPEEAVLCMLDLKHERLRRNPRHADSILDTAGYAAILREIAQ